MNLLPYQSLVYHVEFGEAIPEGPSRERGHKLIESGDVFHVVNEPYISWSVPRDLKGLLSSVRSGDLEYLQPDSGGLLLCDRTGKEHPPGGSRDSGRESVQVIRNGPLAVGLRFEFTEADPALEDVRSMVDLVFPVFKSWVEVDWRIDDPQKRLSGVGAKMDVNVDEPTRQASTLVDFGATSLVYLALRAGRQTELRAGPMAADTRSRSSESSRYAWQVLRGRTGRLEPFVSGPKQSEGHSGAEGWAHVMDRKRCLAIAVDGFSRVAEDRLSVSAEGAVQLNRQFRAGGVNARAGIKRLRFWMHFVPFPPQQTAATSPQSMQVPIVTRTKHGHEGDRPRP